MVDTDLKTAFAEGVVATPKKFPVQFKPRSLSHAVIIEREFEALKPFLDNLED